jgi:putative membrane protein
MRKTTYFLAVAGLLLFIILMVREGVSGILVAFAAAGWRLAWIPVFRILPIAMDAIGWFKLFPEKSKPPPLFLLTARWVGESFNTLLPVAEIGGNFIRARLIARHVGGSPVAGATVVVDFTMGLATQAIFALTGVFLLLRFHGGGNEKTGLFIGLGVGIFLLLIFFLTQHLGLFTCVARIFRMPIRNLKLMPVEEIAKVMDRHIAEIYQNHLDLLFAGSWRLTSWITKTGESWLALYFLGFPVTFEEALILESLSTAIRSAAFAVPCGLGVQEGGILLIGNLVGLPPQTALALALVKRVRELIVGFPGIIAGSVIEANRL